MGWYFRVGELTQGPISARRMRQFAQEGKLRPDHKVSSDKLHWFRADQVFEFGATSPTVELGETAPPRPIRRGLGLPLTVALIVAVVIGLPLAAFAAWKLLVV